MELIHLLPLPAVWLAAYAVGRLMRGVGLGARNLAIAALSGLTLFLACSLATGSLYAVLAVTTVACGALLDRVRRESTRKALAGLAIAGLLVVLVLYLGAGTPMAKLFPYLPSLSYAVFRGIALVVDQLRGARAPASAMLAQMLFLPVVVLGPITRLEHFRAERYDYGHALRRLVHGLGMLIAGTFASRWVLRAADVADLHPEPPILWLGAVANSFELYCTFSGYTSLVLGLGLLLGYALPENFQYPYLAPSVTEFWRRWHMSLSFFIRDYVYIPLGGSRRGIVRKNLNLVAAMGLCGLWHGLTLHFLVWGLYHGGWLALESTLRHFEIEPLRAVEPRIRLAIGIASNFLIVTIGWIFFTYDMETSLLFLRGMIGLR